MTSADPALAPMPDLPRLLADLPRPRGIIKDDPADFAVEEVPLYVFGGQGTHLLFEIEKTGMTTMQAIAAIAAALGRSPRDIGYAGLKDARARARQWLSLEHVEPQRLEALDLPRVRVLQVTRHGNKLRLGHLRGNRFVIRVRETSSPDLAALREGLTALTQRGVPNYFGPQRFGTAGANWRVGRALLLRDDQQTLRALLGEPQEHDLGASRQARELFDRGELEKSLQSWPASFRDERTTLKALLQGRSPGRALAGLARNSRSFYLSAYQSHLFNCIVALRLPSGLDRLMDGDLAWRHPGGEVFRVESASEQQPRADCFEISPSGPLIGYRMSEPAGAPGDMERGVFEREGIAREVFRGDGLRVKGARRPLRFPLADTSLELAADERGEYLELRCFLPAGSYATVLLRELFDIPTAGITGRRSG